jgi:hypothetical protein
MHLVTHYSLVVSKLLGTADAGFTTSTGVMRQLRVFYQNPVVETCVFLALFTHMGCNTMIYLRRSATEAKIAASKKTDEATSSPPSPKASHELLGHRYTGYFLALTIFGHVLFVRIIPVAVLSDPSAYDYSFITAAYKDHMGMPFAIYLVLLGMAGGWHLIYGTWSALVTLGVLKPSTFPFFLKPIAGLSHLLMINAVLCVVGYYFTVDTSTKAALYEKVYFMYQK